MLVKNLPVVLKDNPFFATGPENRFVPAWDRIKPEHIEPALDYALAEMRQRTQRIHNNSAAPTFKNTVEALETSNELASYFFSILFNMVPADAEEQKFYDDLELKIFKKYADIWRDTFTDPVIYKRLQDISKTAAFKKLGREEKTMWEQMRNGCRDSGISMSAQKRYKLHQIDMRMMVLEHQCQINMREANGAIAFTIDDKSLLAGLPSHIIREAADLSGVPGQWAFTYKNAMFYNTLMQAATNRTFRETLWRAHHGRAADGPFDNREIILELNALRQERAQMLGHKDQSAYTFSFNTQAGSARRVSRFLNDVRKAATPVAKREIAALAKLARQMDGVRKLEAWDVPYYEEILKKRTLNFNEQELRPYFELENVLQGAFRHFNKMTGLSFQETKAYPKYHDDVRSYDVYDKDRKFMGVLFLDLMQRDSKPPGIAWSMSALTQGMFRGAVRRPINIIVTKFEDSQGNEPILLTHYDVSVLFHELGHATHDLASRCHYQANAGTNVSTDFVEFPSMMNENWVYEPEVLDDFARHYRTGKPIPDGLKQKIKESRSFMGGNRVLNSAMRGWLDLSWARTQAHQITSVEAFERAALKDFRVVPDRGGLLSPSFSHIFGGGYDCAFYSYQWSEMHEATAFRQFQKKGLYDADLTERYTKMLEQGGNVESNALYLSLTGQKPKLSAYLEREGLLTSAFNKAAANNSAAPAVRAATPRYPKRVSGPI